LIYFAYAKLVATVHNPIVKVIFFGVISLSAWHAADRMRTAAQDLGLGGSVFVKTICYGSAILVIFAATIALLLLDALIPAGAVGACNPSSPQLAGKAMNNTATDPEAIAIGHLSSAARMERTAGYECRFMIDRRPKRLGSLSTAAPNSFFEFTLLLVSAGDDAHNLLRLI